MKRGLAPLLFGCLALLAFAGSAAAAAPSAVSPSATDIQGVSALLRGVVETGGQDTSYRYQYVAQASFEASGFATAASTAAVSLGAGAGPRAARAAISGLTPATTYRFRLLADNSEGSASVEASFTTSAGFGFLPGEEGFSVRAIADGGATASQAGLHPYQLDLGVGLRSGGEFEDQPGAEFPDGDLRNLTITFPPGLLLNPGAIASCPRALFEKARESPFEAGASGESCPDNSQIGTAEVATSRDGGKRRRFGLFNLTPPSGVAAEIGFAPYGAPVVLDLAIPEGPGGSTLALSARDVPQSIDLRRLDLSLWGTPWATSHDGERGNCLNEAEPAFPWAKCSVGGTREVREVAYLSLPARCASSLPFSATATSWQQPAEVSDQAENRNPGGPAVPLSGCDRLSPGASATGVLTDKKASSPSGYNFTLESNGSTLTDPGFLLTPATRRAVVALPNGVTINPSVGEGLGTCRPAQYAAETASTVPGEACPNGSKIGDFSVRSQLFDPGERFSGAIYLATPHDNPFGSLVAVYLVAKLPQRGIQVKLAGRIDPDPVTGNLTASFDGLPQIPYTDLDLDFRTGQRSFLITPPACGQARSTIALTPWAEGLAPTTSSDGSVIESGIEGGPCPAGIPPFHPAAAAGGFNPNVGSYTPYFVHLTRRDDEQEITSYSLVLPKGITAKLAGIPFCPDAAIAAARAKSGSEETAAPSCPAASQVGRTLSGYGVGGALTYAPGRVYLAGPYHGAPLSLVTINSATVGPFDLGTIVIRSAFQLNPLTAQLQIDSRASDPIPHILEGIPLDLRDVRIFIDRPEFTHNPSSCQASQLTSTLTGSGASFGNPADDSTATATSYFQLLNCLSLGFHPRLGIRLRGGTERGDFPSLRATFASRGPRDSNLKRIEVTMPHSEFLAEQHIRTICTRPQFAAERCPPGSVYGKAVAYTSLFDQPLRGSVYLRSSSHRLPDLAATLRSGSIRIDLSGRIGPAKGGIRVLFDEVPDAPISRFVLTLFGGKRSLLVNSADICASPPRATVRALGQNDVGASFTTKLRGRCQNKHHGHGKQHGHRGTGKGAKR